MGKTRPPYPPEFRAEAIRLVRSGGLTQSQVSCDLGVSTFTLRNWLRQTEIDAGEREGLTTDEREELRRLRKENRVLREEREILGEGSGFLRAGDRSPSMKYRLIDAEKPHHAVSRLARTLGA
jgi:transposase